MPSTAFKDIIAVGGSAGSVTVLRTLVADLPGDLPASVFVSTHIPSNAPGFLPEILASKCRLPVTQAIDGQPIERGHIYVAAPDRHLLLMGEAIKFGAGTRENMVRPAIDPMFRSAALSFGPRVVGLVLTGMLNDGAAGLHAIKSNGGTTVVQHPLDAEADQMPLAALNAVEVDHVAAAADLGRLVTEIAGSDAGPDLHLPTDDLLLEVEIATGKRLGTADLRKIATPTAITCPDCHGVLSEVRGSRPLRFRCQIGHAYTADAVAAYADEFDDAIRIAMRVMEERLTLVERMARDARDTGRAAVAELYEARASEYRRYSATLREAALTSLRLGGASRFQDS
ncbi:chemotaxis protein CheB [Rhizobium hidalgonense]|uniref:chemotaxis protein CheB n=1 Tax=Rhizobium hidalgonense TaxID=1538159 RepID=UPI0028718EBC|nr:chemotaxis protein CheB [Rhizobium hidalgonense]MDR9814110.1 chemotaxis protein CheB [Rhizobium hidalgonense]